MYACRTGQAQTHQARNQARLDRARPGNRLAWPGRNRSGARPGQAGKKWPVGISVPYVAALKSSYLNKDTKRVGKLISTYYSYTSTH